MQRCERCIRASPFFVVLVSPEAVASPWVNREIEHWVAAKDPRAILPVLTDGHRRRHAVVDGARRAREHRRAVTARLDIRRGADGSGSVSSVRDLGRLGR